MRVYDFGVRREYAGPRRIMMRERRMKLTAMRGVGAMMVVVILTTLCKTRRLKDSIIERTASCRDHQGAERNCSRGDHSSQ
jgi:hypothetical protein